MERAITVTQLSTYIKQIFEAEEMLHDVKIFGEISTFQIKSFDIVFYIEGLQK